VTFLAHLDSLIGHITMLRSPGGLFYIFFFFLFLINKSLIVPSIGIYALIKRVQ